MLLLAPKKIAGSPHRHNNLDELMYVLEGTASVLMGDEIIQVAAGSWHLRLRGIIHVVWNSGDENLRLIDRRTSLLFLSLFPFHLPCL